MPGSNQKIDWDQSLRALRAGGLPQRATLRLREEAGPNKRLFTSDLSVNELLTVREAGCKPLSQVMGSSIYHIGKIADYKGATGEIDVLSAAHRNARRLALKRLWLEAKAVGADAVVGMRLAERLITKGAHGKGGDDGDEVIEFSAVGTAIEAPWMPEPPGAPVITDLSGQDLWALAKEGFAPTGIVFDFCRYHVWHVMKPGFWTSGGEVTSATEAVQAARNLVEQRVIQQAQDHEAEFVVGSELEVKVHEVPCGYHECPLNDLDIDVSWFGTGVRRIPDFKPSPHGVPPLILGMMPLGRVRTDDLLEGDSDAEELKKQAEEEEKRAAEKEE